MTTVAEASRSPGELANQLLARAPAWILGLLTFLLAVRAALLVLELAGGPATAAPGRPLTPAAAAISRKVVDIPSILRANLFGQAPVASGADAPVTAMNLKLALVFAANDEKKGWAAIGSSTGDTKLYKVGDPVPGGAVLHAVYVDKVLLDRGGSIESLPMVLRPSQGAVVPQATVINPAMSVARVQQAMQNNPGLINQVIQRQAVFDNGHLRGMRVNPGSNAQAFARLGLRANDIVTAINGTALDDQARSNEVFNTLGSSAVARVTVLRSGREQELTLNLAEIANEAERLADAPPGGAPEPPPPGPESER